MIALRDAANEKAVFLVDGMMRPKGLRIICLASSFDFQMAMNTGQATCVSDEEHRQQGYAHCHIKYTQ